MAKVNNAAKAALGKIGSIDAPSASFSNTKSIDFDGTDDYAVSAGNTDSAVLNNRLKTISLWFKSSDGSQACLFDLGLNTMIIEINGNNLYFRHGITNATMLVHWSHRSKWLNTGAWVHVVCTISQPGGNGTESIGKVYLDAVEVESDTATKTESDITADKVSAGCDKNGYKPYENSIDEISWWDGVALDADAITAIYNSGVPIDLSVDSGNYDNSSALVHWWRMGDGDTYPTLQDSVGSLDLTMTNMASDDIVDDVPS